MGARRDFKAVKGVYESAKHVYKRKLKRLYHECVAYIDEESADYNPSIPQ
jgi:hypothetical protein